MEEQEPESRPQLRRQSRAKACDVCRRRKVRCDRERPCANCVRNEEPQSCTYQAGSRRRNRRLPSAPGARERLAALANLERRMQTIAEEVTIQGQAQTLQAQSSSISERCLPNLRLSPGQHPRSDQTGSQGFIGAESLAATLINVLKAISPSNSSFASGSNGEILESPNQDFAELLCMTDTGVTHPFASLWAPGASVKDVCLALPDDQSFDLYLSHFFDVAHLLPSAPPVDFQKEARHFRQAMSIDYRNKDANRSAGWLAVLFSVLACGCSLVPISTERSDLNSRVFVCSTFQLLRLDNYLLNPRMDHVRALSFLSGCLRYHANPDASWKLLGLTIRLAQSLGLHCAAPPREDSSPRESEAWALWQGLLWDDTILSLCYDRPCNTWNAGFVPRIARLTETGLSFIECCHGQAMIMNDIQHERARSQRTRLEVSEVLFEAAEEQIMLYEASAQEHLRDRCTCKDDRQRAEHDVFQIFTTYFLFHLRRQHIASQEKSSNTSMSDGDEICIERCQSILEAYLRLRTYAQYATKLWTLVHILLSCAFFLATNTNLNADNSSLPLLQDLCHTYEQSIKYSSSSHPHYVTILQTLQGVSGIIQPLR
ncbi:hypothetical protein B7463_g10085, partial [Scytalidium lignicola]